MRSFFQVCSFLNSIKSGYIEKQKVPTPTRNIQRKSWQGVKQQQCSLCLMCSCVPQSAGTTYGPIKNNTSQLLEQVRCANTAAQPPIVIPYFYESAHGTKSFKLVSLGIVKVLKLILKIKAQTSCSYVVVLSFHVTLSDFYKSRTTTHCITVDTGLCYTLPMKEFCPF